MSVIKLGVTFVTIFYITTVDSTFSFGFRQFLLNTYGQEVATNLTRLDWGVRGSFGGGNWSYSRRTEKIPVVVVHGLGNVMGDYHELRAEFIKRGYEDHEIYGTTYGHISKQIGIDETIECQFVKQIRQLLIAVISYTQSTVYVIGNSLGGPISRKAILGGRCVDTNEDLGPPLTYRIASYLGVAGAMRGSVLCMGIFSDLIPICNRKNGLNQNSEFIKDINTKPRYESSRILILESKDDDMIGFESKDGTRLMEVTGADKIVVLNNVTHERTVFGTQPLQYDFLVRNKTDFLSVIPSFIYPNQIQL